MARTKQTARQSTGGRVQPVQVPAYVPTTREGLQALTVPQLKAILKSRGLKVGGKKAELVDRILGVTSPPTATVTGAPMPLSNRLSGMVIAVTGTLWIKRDDIERLITANGGRFAKTITKSVTHLVAKNPYAGTAKLSTAQDQGIQVVGEDFLKQLVTGAPALASPLPTGLASPLPTGLPVMPAMSPIFGLPPMPTYQLPTVQVSPRAPSPTTVTPTALSPVPAIPTSPVTMSPVPAMPTVTISPVTTMSPMPAMPMSPVTTTMPMSPMPAMPMSPVTTMRVPPVTTMMPMSPVPAMPTVTMSPITTMMPMSPIVGVTGVTVITTPLTPIVPAPTTVDSPVDYNRYSQGELLTLVRNLYGVQLLNNMGKNEIIRWMEMRETMGQRPTGVVGAGPRAGALSPVITAATQLPVLPALTPTTTMASPEPVLPSPGMVSPLLPTMPAVPLPIPREVAMSPLPPSPIRTPLPAFPDIGVAEVTVVTSPLTSPVQLPPMPVVRVEPFRATETIDPTTRGFVVPTEQFRAATGGPRPNITATALTRPGLGPMAISSPMATLPPIPTVTVPTALPQVQLPAVLMPSPMPIPAVVTAFPPVPPVAIQAAISPEPVVNLPPVGGTTAPAPVIAGGFGDMPTELPTITAPVPAPNTGLMTTTAGMGIAMPVIPTVIPTQSIRLPSPEHVGIPQPIPLPAEAMFQMFPPQQPKVGPGGLSIQTDLGTLNQLRTEINTAVNINPNAAFQEKTPAYGAFPTVTLAPLPAVTLAPLMSVGTGVPPPQPTRPLNEICLSLRHQLMSVLSVDEARLNTVTMSALGTVTADPTFYNHLGSDEADLLRRSSAGWIEQRGANPGYDPLVSCENLVMLQAAAVHIPQVTMPQVTTRLPPSVPMTIVPPPVTTTMPLPVPMTRLPPPISMTQPSQPMVPTPGMGFPGMTGLPPLPAIAVTPGGPVQVIVTQPVQPVQPTQPNGFQPLRPLPQIMTSPAPQPAVQMPQTTTALPTAGPTVMLPGVQTNTVALPTARLPIRGTQQKIHLPKIKETAAIPSPQPTAVAGFPQIRLPTMQTVMQPIALTSPMAVSQQQETGLAVAYTPKQQVVENIMKIDPKRLNPRRARKDDNSYAVKQLRAIAGSINLPKSGNKKELVDRIKAAILKVNPQAFNQ